MTEQVFDTLANVAITLAAFSGLVVGFRVQGTRAWSPTELRVLWFLVIDSFLVVLFALLPMSLTLTGLSPDALWGVTSAMLGTWFLIGAVLWLLGEVRDRTRRRFVMVPWFTTVLYSVYLLALLMGLLLWWSVSDLVAVAALEILNLGGVGAQPPIVAAAGGAALRGQALYSLGLIVLLAFAAVEFLYFIGLMSRRNRPSELNDPAA